MGYNRKKFLKKLGMGATSALLYPALPNANIRRDGQSPNFIFILLDDMGYGDPGCYGNPFNETPNIDQLADDGVRFTQAYAAAPNCSPTRASILTGQYPARVGITQYIPGNKNYPRFKKKKLVPPDMPDGLPPQTTTIAEALQPHGYNSALFGKWHLGEGKHAPTECGFRQSVFGGPYGNHNNMFAPYGLDFETAEEGEYLTDFLTNNALNFIESQKDNPFFLFLPYYSVHSPIGGKQELIEKYQEKSKDMPGYDPEYAAMVEGVDHAVGRIREKVRNMGIAENTQIIFFSDNGGSEKHGGKNGPFRKQKGWLYEGGIRVPFITAGYGVEPSEPNDEVTFSTDFLPTILDYAGIDLPDDYPGDGLSLKPVISEQSSLKRDTYYWHYPHYSWAGSPPTSAIREKNMKLIYFHEDESVELYNLDIDPDESNNLADRYPKVAKDLLDQLSDWWDSVDAKMPTENPDYDSDET